LAGLEELASDCPIIFPVHPRTRQRISEFGFERFPGATAAKCEGDGNRHNSLNGQGIIFTEPLGYLDFLCLMKHAAMVITDSGGIQEETTCLGIPCVTVRENTERPVTVLIGTNMLAGTRRESIKEAIRLQSRRKPSRCMPENWDGQAAARIVHVLSHARQTTNIRSGAAREAGAVVSESADVATEMAQ
jgi:UDP-N-acetylglucosamine 2-epimerase (non-hydrolysing)